MIWFPLLQMGGTTGGWQPFAFLGPVVGLSVMGAVAYLLWRSVGGSSATPSARREDAVETLRERYARGEIDEEEFEERARTLRER